MAVALATGGRTSFGELIADAGRSAIVSGVSKDPNGKVTLLLVPRGERYATVVAKVATTPESERALEAEAAVLAGVDRARLGQLESTVPEVVGWSRCGQRLALILTGVRGTTMLSRYHGWRHTSSPRKVAADFDAVDRWLTRFQAATSAGNPRPLVDGDVLERLSGRFQDDPLAPDAARCLEAIDDAFRAVRVSESAVHGDLWVGNLLVTDGSVSGVVDWEAGSVRGVPTRDPVRFALTYALYLDRHARPGRQVAGHPGLVAGEWGAGIRHMVTGGSWFSDTVRRFLQSWMTRTGVEPRLWRSMALRGLAEIAATADDPVFARRHLEVFVDLAQTPTASPRRHEA